MKHEIKNQSTGNVQFTAEIDATEDTPARVKVGLAVRWGHQNDACLRDASLRGAYLRGAYLRGASLRDADLTGADLGCADLTGTNLGGAYLEDAYLGGADLEDAYLGGADLRDAYLGGTYLVDGGQRRDGFRFVGWVRDGVLQIRAGCRNFAITEARGHWSSPDYPNEELGKESLLILDRLEQTALLRGLVSV